MRNILIPIDGTERSMKSVILVKSLYPANDVKITLLMVREDMENLYSEEELEKAKSLLKPALDVVADQLNGYSVEKEIVFGNAGKAILIYAEQNDIDIIVMTKSTRTTWLQRIGSVTEYVVKYAKCIVMIAPENNLNKKSLQRKYLEDTVTLSAQLSIGSSSCLLPVQAGKCIFKITVINGILCINHLSYNPDGGTWVLARQPSQYNLNEGDQQEIGFEVSINFGNMDRIEIVNKHMTKPLKFHYTAKFKNVEV